jgi:1-deoxy-D-xylulose-5-phosphate synthase
VVTKKGKGHSEAENNPEYYHGVAKPGKHSVTYTSIVSRTLTSLAEKDSRITAITAAMKEGTGLKEFSERFPERFFDVGIAEQHAVTFAAGLASRGLKPFVAIYSTFLQRAIDQVIHDAALPRLPVRLLLDRSGVVGDDGPTHNGQFDISFLTMVPNLVVLAPMDENELQHLLAAMADYDKGPVAIRYPRGAGTGVKLDPEPKACDMFRHVVLREGADGLLLAVGSAVPVCQEASELLAAEGIGVTLVNCRCLKPLDEQTLIPLLRKAPVVLTVEENVVRGGFGSSVAELCARLAIRPASLGHMGLPDAFLETASQAILREQTGLTPAAIRDRFKAQRKTTPA